jgi:hypothetical protein
MDIKRSIDDQDINAEEKQGLEDWLTRIADGRLIVRVPAEAFGVRLGHAPDKLKLQALRDRLRIKTPR